MIRGHFLEMVSYLPHVKEPVMKGHLSCRDTFSRILRCPLKTGFTVLSKYVHALIKMRNMYSIRKIEHVYESHRKLWVH